MDNKCMFEGCEHIAQLAVPAKMGLNNEDVTLYLCNEHFSRFGKLIQPTSISMSVLYKKEVI